MSGPAVLVLRPEPGASRTASRLRDAGFRPILLPLSEIHALPISETPDPDEFECVAVTSANALRHAPAELVAGFRNMPLFAVGEATAKIASDLDFSTVIAGSYDGAALAEMITEDFGGPVLYLCGHVRRPEFEQILASNNVELRAIETYDTIFSDRAAEFRAILEDEGPISALCHSPEAAFALARLIGTMPETAEKLSVVAISARAAEPLLEVDVEVEIAEQPTDDAMISALG